MLISRNGEERSVRLETGDVFFAEVGCEHVAHPIGEARYWLLRRNGVSETFLLTNKCKWAKYE